MSTLETGASLPYQPRFPADYQPGIGIIGCGSIVKTAHLVAYQKYGLNVIGVYDPSLEATRGVTEQFGVGRVFGSVDELLAHPTIEVVDVATHPEHRLPLVQAALDAGKHVLSQKPFALDLAAARATVDEAARRRLTLAVNQNGRWAPPWRVATLLIAQGQIGDVGAVTHLFERRLRTTPGTRFDALRHFAIYDYAIHWIDISRIWLAGKRVSQVRARNYRIPGQPEESVSHWGMWVEITFADGSNVMIRGVGGVETNRPGHPFWIHGAAGTIRGSVLGGDGVEVDTKSATCRYELDGHWFPDGFAGAMGELLCAIAEEREPQNSARDNLLTLEITLAACRSADEDGRPIAIIG